MRIVSIVSKVPIALAVSAIAALGADNSLRTWKLNVVVGETGFDDGFPGVGGWCLVPSTIHPAIES
jgi:hypothetical protein